MKIDKIPEESLIDIARMLKALADPMRMKIMSVLHGGERNVGEIVSAVGGLQANVSKHLGVLSRVHLLSTRREGALVYYRIADPCVEDICKTVCGGYARLLAKKYTRLTSR